MRPESRRGMLLWVDGRRPNGSLRPTALSLKPLILLNDALAAEAAIRLARTGGLLSVRNLTLPYRVKPAPSCFALSQSRASDRCATIDMKGLTGHECRVL